MTVLAVAGIAVVGTLSVVAYRWWKNTMGADDDDIEVRSMSTACLFIGGVSCMRRLNLHGWNTEVPYCIAKCCGMYHLQGCLDVGILFQRPYLTTNVHGLSFPYTHDTLRR